MKHEGGATSEEMDHQLAKDLLTWQLNRENFVALVSDTAANMNTLGKILKDAGVCDHHYCCDHNFQLTAVKSYSGKLYHVLEDAISYA